MPTRRHFLKRSSVLSTLALTGISGLSRAAEQMLHGTAPVRKPVVLSTWNHGLAANEAAWKVLSAKGRALDNRGFAAALTETHGKRRAALSRTDHDCIEVL